VKTKVLLPVHIRTLNNMYYGRWGCTEYTGPWFIEWSHGVLLKRIFNYPTSDMSRRLAKSRFRSWTWRARYTVEDMRSGKHVSLYYHKTGGNQGVICSAFAEVSNKGKLVTRTRHIIL
jgi:hypothetical protein